MSNVQGAMCNGRPMKDSGVEWIGEIPEDWKINSAFQIFTQVKNKNSDLQENNLLSLSYGKIKRKSIDTTDGLLPESFDGYNIIEAGDIVLRLTDLQNDQKSLRVGLSKERGIVTSAYLTLRNRSDSIPNYLYYFLHSFDISKGFYGMGAGVRQGLNWDGLKWLKILTPSVQEQRRIADYLDRKCAEIDRVIADTQRTIEEYKALKQSIITEAVTGKAAICNVQCAMCNDRPMKDSGVEWIGEIPEEWEVRPIKNSFTIVSGATPKSDNPDHWDGDVVWITPADYKFEDKYITTGKRNLSQAGYDSCGTTLVPIDSIIFSKRAPIGTVAMAGCQLCTNQGCLSCIPKQNAVSKYFYYAFAAFSEQFNLYGTGTTFKEISFTAFSDFKLPLPTFEEQNEIADWLETRCDKVDKLIKEKQTLLAELETYKKSVIYEYVTGKKHYNQMGV